MDTCDNHEGKYVCLPCARTTAVKKRKNEILRNEDVEEFELGKYSRSSHQRVRAYCELKVITECTQEFVGEYRHVVDVCERTDGMYACMYCCHRTKYMGRGNPNAKHMLDDNLLEHIDSEFKAYLLGWIASDGSLAEDGTIVIKIHKKDRLLLEQLRDRVCKTIEIKERENIFVSLSVCSTTMNVHAAKLLGLSFEKSGSRKKSSIVKFPELATDELKWHFIRGYFDGDGCISITKSGRQRSGIASDSMDMLLSIASFVNIPHHLGKNQIEWVPVRAFFSCTKCMQMPQFISTASASYTWTTRSGDQKR